MIQEVPHEVGEYTMTHHLPPTEVIRMIHSNNRRKFGTIFGADKMQLEQFWSGLFDSDDGKEFQKLHPTLKDKTANQLQTSIPFIVHEDAAPYGKKRSVNVLQWGPLLTKGSDIESRFVHHNYIHKEGTPAETARRAWENSGRKLTSWLKVAVATDNHLHETKMAPYGSSSSHSP